MDPNRGGMDIDQRLPTGLRYARSTPRPSTLKRINMRRFLDELRQRGPSTRAELTRATGVTPPTSSNIIADLLETGLLEESDGRAAAKGRPGKVFRLASASAFIVGATIDVEKCAVAPAGLDGKPKKAETLSFATPPSYEALLDALQNAVQALQDGRSGRCLGLGLSVPGLVEERLGRVAFSPNLQFTNGRSLGPDLEARLGVQVVCTQEEHALCLAEQNLGEAKRLSDFVVLDITSGMGMGVVCGGRYMSGRDGFAGEIGHTTVEPEGPLCGCGNHGCLETLATDKSFLAAVRTRLRTKISLDEVADLVRQGYVDVSQELDSALRYLSIGLASIVNIFNPEAVIIHGKILDLQEDVLPRLTEAMRSRALGPSSEHVQILHAHGAKQDGALAGLLDELFASIGPKLT